MLRKKRKRAAQAQEYRCFYCGMPIWEGEPGAFAHRHRLSKRSARSLQCTAEHVVARKDGGGEGAGNIVAACLACNRRRHRRKKELPVERYRALVRRRMRAGKWHSADLRRRLLPG